MLCAIATLLMAQMSPGRLSELRRYRNGRSSAQVEAMGFDAFERAFDAKHPASGVTRGVAYSVYVDAYRENTGRRYRTSLPLSAQTRLLALDRQMRLIGVLFARNEWMFTGGNAVDPESDALEYAEAERRLYVGRSQAPDLGRMRRRLTDYRADVTLKAKRETLHGAMGDSKHGRAEIDANLRKLDRAVARATALCARPNERAVLFEFVGEQAKGRL